MGEWTTVYLELPDGLPNPLAVDRFGNRPDVDELLLARFGVSDPDELATEQSVEYDGLHELLLDMQDWSSMAEDWPDETTWSETWEYGIAHFSQSTNLIERCKEFGIGFTMSDESLRTDWRPGMEKERTRSLIAGEDLAIGKPLVRDMWASADDVEDFAHQVLAYFEE